MGFLKLSCKKATEMVEQNKIVSLTLLDKVKLKLHLSVCNACRNYQKQSALINQVLKKYFYANNNYESNALKNDELKERIISKLNSVCT